MRSLPRPIWIAFAATLVHRSGTMALPFLVLYLTEERRLPAETAGWTLGVYGAGSLLAGPLAGWLVSRVGARAVMVVSLLGTAVALGLVPILTSMYAVIGLVAVWSVIGESFRPACFAVVADLVEPERRREAFAVLRLAVNLGMSIGPALGGGLAASSYSLLFAVDAGTSLLAAALLALPVARSLAVRPVTGPTRDRMGAGARWPFALHLLATGLVAMVAFQAISTMPLYMVDELSLSPAVYGAAFAFSGVLIVLFEVPFTSLSRRWPHRPLLVFGAAVTGLGFAGLALVHDVPGVLAITAIWTLGEILLGPAAAARVADLEPPHARGLYMGIYNAAWSAAFAVGPWLGTQSLTSFGPITHWSIVGAVGLAGAIIYAIAPAGPDRPPDSAGP